MDNVFVERLWRSIKYEEVYLHAYDSISQAKTGLARYINFHNAERPHSSLCVEYAKFLTVPPSLPTAVKVGDTAIYATLTTFTDSTKIIVTGQRVLSYVVEADSANTAVVNLVSKGYDTLHQLLFTQQSRYRIAADGTLTVLTIDIQYSTTSTTHLLYTRV